MFPFSGGVAPECLSECRGAGLNANARNYGCRRIWKVVRKRWLQRLKFDDFFECAASFEKQIAINRRDGEEAWPKVENETVSLVGAKFAPRVGRLFDNGDLKTL